MAVLTYTKTGNKATTAAKLNKAVFDVKAKNHELLKLAYDTYLANNRQNAARTKTRGEVRGGGKKPWRQKGTGRARFGSSRNPIWRGGGIAFGPTGEENYSKKLTTVMKRQAVRQALSLAAEEGRLVIIESLTALDGKTKATVALLQKIDASGSVLVVVGQRDASKEQGTRNIPGLRVCGATYLTTYDLINADKIVMTQEALDKVHDWLIPIKPASSVKEGRQ